MLEGIGYAVLALYAAVLVMLLISIIVAAVGVFLK